MNALSSKTTVPCRAWNTPPEARVQLRPTVICQLLSAVTSRLPVGVIVRSFSTTIALPRLTSVLIVRFQKKLVALLDTDRPAPVLTSIVELLGVRLKLTLVASHATRMSWVKVTASHVPVVSVSEPVTVRAPVDVIVLTAALLLNTRSK